jgi:hypothetical protein
MPIDVQMPDGTIISGVPDNITQADLLARYKAYAPPEPTGKPVPDELGRFDAAKQPTAGVRRPEDVSALERNIGAGKRGFESLGDVTGGIGLASTAITGTEAETAAKMREIKRQQAQPQETPGLTAGDIERIYKEKGLGAAAAQVPSFITESILASAPQMAIPLAAGAAATPFLSPVGGALVGIGTYGVQQFGNFLTRQAQEKNDPKELEILKAAGTAFATAPLGYFADKWTAGLGALGTKKAGAEILKELSARQVAAKVGKRVAVGATEGIIAEAPLEVLEAAAERYQAGLSLTGEDANNEYKESFFGAAGAGAGIGGASRGIAAYQSPVKPTVPPTIEPPAEEKPEAITQTAAPMAAPVSTSQDTQAMIDELQGKAPAVVSPVEVATPTAFKPNETVNFTFTSDEGDKQSSQGVVVENKAGTFIRFPTGTLENGKPTFSLIEVGKVDSVTPVAPSAVTPPVTPDAINPISAIETAPEIAPIGQEIAQPQTVKQTFQEKFDQNKAIETELKDLYKERNTLAKSGDNLIPWLKKYGVKPEAKADMGIEKGNRRLPVGIFKKSGYGLDELARAAVNDGIITEADLAAQPDEVEAFRELIYDAVQGNVSKTPFNLENMAKLDSIQQRIEQLESPEYALSVETSAESEARLNQEQVDKKAQEDAAIEAEMAAKAEQSRAEIAKLSAQQAENFALGQTPEESLTGQQRLTGQDEDIPFSRSKVGSTEEIELAEKVANVYRDDGRDSNIVYQNGDLALIQTRKKNGDVIYMPIKGQRHSTNYNTDISTDQGSQLMTALKLTQSQKDDLIKAKEEIEAAETEKHKQTPFLTIKPGVTGSSSIPKEFVNVARGFVKMLGITGDIYIISKTEAADSKNKFTGPHRPIGYMGDKVEFGSVRQLDDGSHVMVINPGTSKIRTIETIAHELGHIHETQVFDNAKPEVQKAIIKEFNTWFNSQKNMSVKELVDSLRPKVTAQQTEIVNPMGRATDLDRYWKNFPEWYADQVSRWATTSDKPLTVVDKFFKKLADALKKFYQTLKGQKYLPTQSMKEFLDSIATQSQFESIKQSFDKGQMALFSKSKVDSTEKTNTPEFKKWFGNSKITNEDGSPKVVYHGTDKPDFDIFDPASWFTDNTKEAGAYAQTDLLRNRERLLAKYKLSEDTSAVGKTVPFASVLSDIGDLKVGEYYAEGGYDGPVYKYLGKNKYEVLKNVVVDLDSANLNDMTIKLKEGKSQEAIDQVNETKEYANEFAGGEGGRVYPVYLSIKNPLYLDAMEINSFSKRLGKSAEEIQKQVDKWKSQGYDGIITTSDEARFFPEVREALDGIPNQYIPFDAIQIKSATGNKGTYKADSGDITESKGKVETSTDAKEKPTTEARNYLGQPVKPTWEFPEDTFIHVPGVTDVSINDLIYKFQDKQIDTKRAQEAISKAAGVITDDINVYEKEQLFHGKVATAIREYLLNELLPAIKKLKALNLKPQEMQDYLLARHAEERNNKMNELNKLDPRTGEERTTPWNLQDRASGMSTADARALLKGLDPAKKANLETVAKMFDDMVTGTQKILVDSGADSQDTVDAWNETYKHYVPLFRVEEDFINGGMGATGLSKGFNVSGNFSKRAMGSEKEVQDIIANLIKQRERALIRAEKLTITKALYGLFLMNPNPDVALPVNPDAIKSKTALIQELESLGYDNAEEIANNLMEEPKSRYISKDRVIDKNTGLPTADTEESVKLKVNNLDRFGDNVLTLRIDGKNRYIFFNQKNPDAMRMATSLKSLDVESLGTLTSLVSKATRWFASVNTQYNPIFAAVNLIRDVGGAQFNLTTTPLAGKQAQVTAGIFPAMKGIFKILRAERKGEVGGNSDMEKAFRDFRKEGGQTGYRDSLARRENEQSIVDEQLKKITSGGNAKKAFKAVFGALSDFNDTLENSIRLSAYMQASKPKSEGGLGLSKQQAAIIAKNLTVNFDKKGQLSSNINALYAFFNASVQGTARLAQTLKGPKGKAIIGGGILLGSMQAILLAAAGFKDDEPPEFIKERNFIIPTPGGGYLSIPYPLGLNILPSVGRLTTEFVLTGGKNPTKKVGNLIGVVAGGLSPVGSADLLQTIAPTVLDPLAALKTNTDAFGRPIYKKDQATNPTPGYMRSRESSSEISKQISYFLNMASGGGKYSKGLISPTADEIDYVAGQVTGGVGRELMKAGQTIKAVGTGEDLPAYRVPLAGRFYGETESNAAESQRFYSNVTKMADHENEIKGRIKNKEPVGPYLKDHPEARLWQSANSTENQITALNKQKKEFIERGLPKDRIKRIENQKAVIMKRFNDQLSKYED